MFKSRAVRIISCFMAVCVGVVGCSLFVFGYSALLNFKSSQWHAGEKVYSAVYPEPTSADLGFADEVYSYEDLFGDTYFFNNWNWQDEYSYIDSADFYFPAFPNDDFMFNFHIVYRFLDTYFLIHFIEPYLNFAYDKNTALLYYYPQMESDFYVYSLSYPYTNWIHDSDIPAYDLNMYAVYPAQYVDIVYSDVDIYTYSSDGSFDMNAVYRPADTYDLQSVLQTINFEHTLSVLVTAIDLTITIDDLRRLTSGSYCLLIDDCGIIVCTSMDLCLVSSTVTVVTDSVVSDPFQLSSLILYDRYVNPDDSKFDVGSAVIDDTILDFYLDNGFEEYPDFHLVITTTVISDAMLFYFPGDITIINFDDWEEDEHHRATLDAISSVASDVTSAVNSAAADITTSISVAASDIKTAVFDSSEDIQMSIGSAAVTVTNKLDDIFTNDLPDVQFNDQGIADLVQDEDDMIANVLDIVNQQRDQYLLELGYNDYGQFLADNVDQLNSKFFFAFMAIRTLFDDIVSVTDVYVLLIFTLAFGFCMYVLGRKLS